MLYTKICPLSASIRQMSAATPRSHSLGALVQLREVGLPFGGEQQPVIVESQWCICVTQAWFGEFVSLNLGHVALIRSHPGFSAASGVGSCGISRVGYG